MNNRLLCVLAMLAMLSLPLSMGTAKAAEVIGSTTDGYLGASSTKILLKDGGSIHYEFTQQTAAEQFWHGFVLMVENAYGGSPFVALRCDNWENRAWSNEGCTSDFNWDTFISMMNGASIDMDINYENGTFSMSSTIRGSDNNTYNYSFSKTITNLYVVVVYLSEDHAQLTINTTEVKKPDLDNPEAGNIISYNYNENNKTAEVTKSSQYTWGYKGDIVIPKTVIHNGETYVVTSIDDYAFRQNKYLTSVNIPNSVTSIGLEAFAECYNLESVLIPNSVTSIEGGTFRSCSSLTDIIIPNSVTTIGSSAFKFCFSLTEIDIPNSVELIELGAFNRCIRLANVNIGSSVTTIKESAFKECIYLENVTIGNSVETIEREAFQGCEKLKKMVIPNSVTNIGISAFSGCSSLTNVSLPNSIASIGIYAFEDCSSLTSVSIPNSLTTISDGCFYKCGLKSVNIPNSITVIERGAFYGCVDLKNVAIPSSVQSIGIDAFMNCENLEMITIPNSVTSIDKSAFCGCVNLKSIILPNSLTTIREGTFQNCQNLNRVDIPRSVKTIEKEAFYICESINDIYCYANPTVLTWEDNEDENSFKPNRETKFHVYKKSEWEEAFPNAYVTFVEDLKHKVGTNVIIRDEVPEYWSSYYDSSVNHIADENVKVYIMKIVNDELQLELVSDRIINKGQGVLLKSTTQDVQLAYSEVESSTDYSENSLIGSDVEITNPGNAYVLNCKEAGLGFYKLSTVGKIRSNKAYFVYSNANARDFMLIDDEDVTGIKGTANNANGKCAIYNLNGQLVSHPSKGLYVKDGKKVMVK